MSRSGFYIALLVVSLAPGLAAQGGNKEDIFTITIAPPTSAKDVQVRYFIAGEFGGYGSSVADQVGRNRIVIRTGVEGKSAKTLKAIVYAPGCQFVTIAVDDLGAGNRQGDFQCQTLPTIQLHGRIDPLHLAQREVSIEALYVCNWAMPFFGIADGSVSPLTLGKTPVATDGSFTIELPDFTADPTWPALSKEAELKFFLKDSVAGPRVASLVVSHTRSGNLSVSASYPEVAFEMPEM